MDETTSVKTPDTIHPDQAHRHTHRCWWDVEQARWVCPPSGADEPTRTGAPPADRPLVDVRDMLVVHTAMLRELRLLPGAVARTKPGDRRQAQAVAAHLHFVCELLDSHHHGEDVLLWPKLRERTGPATEPVIEAVEGQHHDIEASLARVEQQRTAWLSGLDASTRDALVDALERLHVLLREHLDLEERALLPVAASVLTEREWEEIGEHGMQALPKPALPLVFGMFAYEGDPAVLKAMLSAAPLVPRTLLPLVAPRVYARRARRVHGTPQP